MNSSLKTLLLNIDGLRRDVFLDELERGRIPNLRKLVGNANNGARLHVPAVSCAPSITFCCQATICTGATPNEHCVVGNQFFDRLGLKSGNGKPRFYGFDIGEDRKYADALMTFRGSVGLANQLLPASIPTLYERSTAAGLTSVVANCMYARGATRWLRPSVLELARFTKGGGVFGLAPDRFDGRMVHRLVNHMRRYGAPDVTMAYFLAIDHVSHRYGPGSQRRHLRQVIDPLVGALMEEYGKHHPASGTLAVVLSDHGTTRIARARRFQLLLHTPLRHISRALPLENRLVGAGNGGIAMVYVRRNGSDWSAVPDFESEVLPTAQAFLKSSRTGSPAMSLKGGLRCVLVRNGWENSWELLEEDGTLVSLDTSDHPEISRFVDPVYRLGTLRTPLAGDIILVPDCDAGFHFGGRGRGIHGGFEAPESECTLSIGQPNISPAEAEAFARECGDFLSQQFASRGRNFPSLEDITPLVAHLMGLRALSAPKMS